MKKERFKKRKRDSFTPPFQIPFAQGVRTREKHEKIVRAERGNRISGKEINTEYLSASFANLKTLINTVQNGIFGTRAKLQFI